MFTTRAVRRTVFTSDGVSLSFWEAGDGPPLLMIPGWSQAAIEWHAQIEAFSRTHRVIALDMRGHGQSETPEFGYRMARLAKDVRDVMVALDLDGATAMGHSLGCSVLLCLFDLFGADRIEKLVLVDEPAWLFSSALLSEEEAIEAGASFTVDDLVHLARRLGGPDGEAASARMLEGMFTEAMDPAAVADVVALNLQLPRPHAASLIVNHVMQDWRDVYRRISVPTLLVAGRASVVDWRSVAWQSREIPDARLEIFERDEGGGHFMFMENPNKFNAILADFLGVRLQA